MADYGCIRSLHPWLPMVSSTLAVLHGEHPAAGVVYMEWTFRDNQSAGLAPPCVTCQLTSYLLTQDHVEFTIVRESIREALQAACTDVICDVPKSVLRQAAAHPTPPHSSCPPRPPLPHLLQQSWAPPPCAARLAELHAAVIHRQGMIQHLYGRLSGRLRPEANDATLLAALHPTPAVCGHPQQPSMDVIRVGRPSRLMWLLPPAPALGFERH